MTIELAIDILTGNVIGTTEQMHEAVKMAIEALKAEQDMESAYAHGYTAAEAEFYQWKKAHEQKWISCSEKYPEMDERVIVNLDGRYDIHVWDCASNRDDDYYWEDESGLCHNKYEVMYWLPLPELC